MRRVTHVLFSIATSGILSLWKTPMGVLPVILVGASSLIPDLDLRKSHRRLLHNIFAPTVISLLAYILLEDVTTHNYVVSKAIFIGWVSHIFLDSLTLKGVGIFYPFLKKHYGLRLCESNNIVFNVAISTLSILLIAYYSRLLFFT